MRTWQIITLQIIMTTVIVFIGAEIYLRYTNKTATIERSFIPYLMNGHFKGPNIDQASAEAYDYKAAGLTYIYQSSQPVQSMSERGDFLYQGRLSKNPDRKRIFIMGASTAGGEGASHPDKRWFLLLEKELRERLQDSSIDVVPASISGYVSAQERLVLDFFILSHQPAVVINIDAYNDASVILYGARPGDPAFQGLFYSKFNSGLSFQVFYQLARHSLLVRKYFEKHLLHRIWSQVEHILVDPQLLENYIASVVSIYSENIQFMDKRCKQEKVACYFLQQPAETITELHRGKAPRPHNHLPEIYQRMYAAVTKNTKSSAVNYYDYTSLFDHEPEVTYTGEVHFNDKGQQIMAHAVADLLIQNKKMWLK